MCMYVYIYIYYDTCMYRCICVYIYVHVHGQHLGKVPIRGIPMMGWMTTHIPCFLTMAHTVDGRNPAPVGNYWELYMKHCKQWGYGIDHLPTGAGFLPSTVCIKMYLYVVHVYMTVHVYMLNMQH